MAAHPVFPFVIVGTRNDDILLLNPHSVSSKSDTTSEVYSDCLISGALGSASDDPAKEENHVLSEALTALQATRVRHRVGQLLPRYDPTMGSTSADVKAECTEEEEEEADVVLATGSVGESPNAGITLDNILSTLHEPLHTSQPYEDAAPSEGEEVEDTIDPVLLNTLLEEDVSSPLFKARQQMLRDWAHMKAATAARAGAAAEQLDISDITVLRTTQVTHATVATLAVDTTTAAVVTIRDESEVAGAVDNAVPAMSTATTIVMNNLVSTHKAATVDCTSTASAIPTVRMAAAAAPAAKRSTLMTMFAAKPPTLPGQSVGNKTGAVPTTAVPVAAKGKLLLSSKSMLTKPSNNTSSSGDCSNPSQRDIGKNVKATPASGNIIEAKRNSISKLIINPLSEPSSRAAAVPPVKSSVPTIGVKRPNATAPTTEKTKPAVNMLSFFAAVKK